VSDEAEKPFEATPQRIAKAKREGNVARSAEFAANLAFAAAALAIVALASVIVKDVGEAVAIAASGVAPVAACVALFAAALVPVACAAAAGVLATLFQSGGITFVAIALKSERLNPAEGIKRILSRETLMHSLRASLAFTIATAAMIPAIASCAVALVTASALAQVAAETATAAQHVAFAACAVGLLFSIAEYASARSAWLRKLRMSFAERKEEAKEHEGDALVRGRRRSIHRAWLRGALGHVKDASLVVANPAHVAVALEYRPPEVCVPRILVRALDEAALHVRRLAASYGIPIVESAALARALYADGRTGEPIPPVHYLAVAEVVAALARNKELAS
jgi:flagellar biosynthesis protein FlhB